MKAFWFSAAILSGGILLQTAPAMAQVDLVKSSIAATGKQLGVPMEGRFRKFTATVGLDAAQPAKSNARVEIDIASYDIGDPAYNQELASKSWFDAAQYPKATFVSSAFKPTGAGRFDVTGKLTIKGKTADVSFPMTVKSEGTTQIFDGVLPIKRSVFNVGDGEWKDTSVVADDVQIKFHLIAAMKK